MRLLLKNNEIGIMFLASERLMSVMFTFKGTQVASQPGDFRHCHFEVTPRLICSLLCSLLSQCIYAIHPAY